MAFQTKAPPLRRSGAGAATIIRASSWFCAHSLSQGALSCAAMAKRPRQHEIEEESLRAFVASLPSGWVPRRQEPDYGFDYVVEIFENGDSTGLSFNAQLKGTDEADLDTARHSLRFEREKADDFRASPLPTLIVRYHAPTGRQFVRWFHSYDPQIEASAIARSRETASITFRFSEADEWTGGGSEAEELVSGVRGFFRFRRVEHRLPLVLAVPPSADGTSSQLLAVALRQGLQAVNDLIRVEHRASKPEDASVAVSKGLVRISLGEIATVSVHLDTEPDTEWLAANIPVALAHALTTIGQTNIAAQLALHSAVGSALIGDPECCMTLAGAFFRSQRLVEALRLIDQLDATGEPAQAAASYFLTSVLLAKGPNLDAEEQALAKEVARARYQRRLEHGRAIDAGTEAYNTAMLHKRLRELEEALLWFEEAKTLEPRYLERGYFHRDKAGVLFGLGDFTRAEASYLRALELGGVDGVTEALAADAMLFAGNYAAAERAFADFAAASDNELAVAEWRLKARVLPLVVARAGDVQERDPEAAHALVDGIDLTSASEDSIAEVRRRVDEALALDGLCPKAWFLDALFELYRTEDPESVAETALLAALLGGGVPGWWANAVALAGEADAAHLRALIYLGCRDAGPPFQEQILSAVASPTSPISDSVPGLLEEAAATLGEDQVRQPFTMRVAAADGSVSEHVFAAAPSSPDTAPEPVAYDQSLVDQLHERLGEEWWAEAESAAVEVTEQGDTVVHSGKWISFMRGKDASEGMILALNRGQTPALISIVKDDGTFELLGPVDDLD